MSKTKIEWSEVTWNPVLGCSKVSEGCRNCYAMMMSSRIANAASARAAEGKELSDVEKGYQSIVKQDSDGKYLPKWNNRVALIPGRLEDPLHWRKPRLVFVNSMSDLFHPDVPFEFIDKVFHIMMHAQNHTFQILTKRPGRMAEYFKDRGVKDTMKAMQELGIGHPKVNEWPLPNVWLGTSCEDQAAADERIPHLLECPAAVRFLSCEPLLGPVDLSDALGLSWEKCDSCGDRYPDVYWADDEQWEEVVGDTFAGLRCPSCFKEQALKAGFDPKIEILKPPLKRIDWVIAGGESGHNARPMHPDWVRNLRDQCQEAGVSFFFKQWGSFKPITPLYEGRDEEAEVGCGDLLQVDSKGAIIDPYIDGQPSDSSTYLMERVGKKKAGRLLDGREWDQMPEVG